MDDLNFAEERRGTFRGLARVALSALNFKPNPTLTKHVSDRNIDRLVDIFELEGCQRAEEQHFLAATVPEAILASLLAETPDALLSVACPRWVDVPFLKVDRLECLTGHSRIRAAERYLSKNDQWWVVKIYSDDIPPSSRVHLAEEFLNEQACSDGEIFFKIRYHHKKKETQNERKWWARLTETKRKDLRQLLKDDRYAEAFDALLDWPGLWAPIRLGSLHRLLSLKCDEELLNYLRHVNAIWKHITADISPCIVDNSTVESLQTLAPLISTEDASLIRRLESDRQIFPRLVHDERRAVLRRNLLSVQHMIPSLHTFFEDIKYLEPCAKVMRGLFSAKTGKSIRQNLMDSFFQPTITTVEYACHDWRSHACDSSATGQELSYQQLWLFALRNFPQMTNATTRKDQDKDKPVAIEPSPIIWQKFGEMAFRNGFRTKEIVQLKDQQCFSLVASQLFRQHTNVNHEDANMSKQLTSALGILQLVREPTHPAKFTATVAISTTQRSGRPFEDDHRNDRGSLYLPQIYRTCSHPGPHITTFFRKWALFRTFFEVKQESEKFDAPLEDAEMIGVAVTEAETPIAELTRLQQEIWNLQAALATEHDKQKGFQDANSEMQRLVEQSCARKDEAERVGREFAAERTAFKQQNATLQREVQELRQSSSNAGTDYNQSVELIDQLKAQLAVAQECTDFAQTELKARERETAEAKEQYKLLERQSRTELDQTRADLESAEHRSHSEIDRMKAASRLAEEQVKLDHSKHMAEWKKMEDLLLEKLDEAEQTTLSETSRRAAENEALQREIAPKDERIACTEAEIAHLTQELDSALSTIVDLQTTQTTSKSVLELLIDEEVAAYDASLTRLEDVGLLILRDCRVSGSGLPISNDYFVPSTLSQGVLSRLEVLGKGDSHYSVSAIHKKVHPSDFTAGLSKPWQMERVLWRWPNREGTTNHSPFQEWQERVDLALNQGLAGRKRDADWPDYKVIKHVQKKHRKLDVADHSADAVDQTANIADQDANVADSFALTRDGFVPE